jgi:hypothetical protein
MLEEYTKENYPELFESPLVILWYENKDIRKEMIDDLLVTDKVILPDGKEMKDG